MAVTDLPARAPLGLLSLASALSPFGMVVVVPTLGAISRSYDIPFSQAQFLISAYLFGLGVAQPVSGLLCDRFGRRPVMLAGFAIFVAASAACALVGDIGVLFALRFLQAVGVSVGTVASRAIVRDLNDDEGTARAMSTIAAAMGLAPVVAPVIGGVLGEAFGPQAVFVGSALIGLAVWLGIRASLRETCPAGTVPLRNLRTLAAHYGELLRAPRFMGYTLMFGFVQGGFFAFLAVGAAVFERDFGMSQGRFGMIWSVMAIAYVGGAAFAGWLTERIGLVPVVRIGLAATLVSGWLVYAVGSLESLPLVPLVLALGLLTTASGLVIPGSMAGAVSYRPEIAGISSGLSSALGLTLSGAFTIAAGYVYAGRFEPVGLVIAVAATLTAATALLVRR